MIKVGRSFLSRICWISLLLSFIFGSFALDLEALTVNKNDELIRRFSDDFSRKFCNGIGFGLSQESAKDFAMKENLEIFKKKKGMENIDKKLLTEKISSSVLDKCDYPLILPEDELAANFKQPE